MNRTMTKMRRRNYLVNKRFQLACAGNMLLLQFLGALATAFAVSWVYYFVVDDQLVSTPKAPFFVKVVTILVFMAIGMLIWTIRHTHAIAGPVFKTGKLLREAAAGSFPKEPVRFRRGDCFHFLADDLNQSLNAMKRDRACLEGAYRELTAFKKRLEGGDLSAGECIDDIKIILDLLDESGKSR